MERRGTICHLIASGFFGGPEKQIVAISTRLRGLGWDVVIGSFREGRASVGITDAAAERGLPTFLIDTPSPFDPSAIGQLRSFLRFHEVDILVTHGYKSNVVGLLATRGSSVRQLPIVRGYTAEDPKVRLYEKLDRWVLRRFDRVLCVSEGTKRRLAGYGIAPGRIEVMHNGVDCDRDVRPMDIIREFSLPAGARVLIAAGRLSPEKGHRFLVEAMARLGALDPAAYCLILGAGKEEEVLRAQARAAGLEGRLVFGGFRCDVPACRAGADLVVNPSLTEGLPNVILEAMAVGTPVVATKVGGVGELIEHGESGWLVPAGDAAALATAIREALADREEARRRGARARSRAVEQFSFDRLAAQWSDLLQSILPQPVAQQLKERTP